MPNKANLCYECEGSGRDVLLVHGFASSLRMWDALVAAMRDDCRFWSVDLCGFGDSPSAPGAPLNLDYHVDTLIDFCESRHIRPAAVIGHSMGGMLTMKLALKRPDLAERLVLAAPVVTGCIGFQLNKLFSTAAKDFVLPRSQTLWTLAQSDFAAALGNLLGLRYGSQPVRERIKRDFQRATWAASMAALESLCNENIEPHLHRIMQPTLVIVGGRDFTVPPSEGRLAATKIPHARLVEFPRCHHQPLDEEPERFLKTVRPFLLEARLS